MRSKTKRLLIAFVMGLVAFVVTALVILRTLPETLSGYASYNGSTQMAMRRVAQRIQQYQEEHSKLPDTLAEVPLGKDGNLDAWKRPLLYERHDSKAILRTLGRDGKSGGEGVDADYTSETKRAPRATIRQVLQSFNNPWTDDYLQKCFALCVLNGLLWFLCPFFSKNEERATKRGTTWHVLNYGGLLALFAVTVVGAVIMTVLDVPTGH